MLIYILIFSLISILAISDRQKLYLIDILFLSLILVIFIGFRYEMGTDWIIYLSRMLSMEDRSFSEIFSISFELSYQVLEFIANRLGENFILLNSVSAILFVVGLLHYCRRQAYPWLSLLIAYPTLILICSFTNTRQSISLGFELLALSNLKYFYRSIFYFIFGATFHQSMLFIVPIPILARMKDLTKIKNLLKIILITLPIIYIVSQFYGVFISDLLNAYILSGTYSSRGAIMRVGYVFIAAVIFQLNKDKFYSNNKFYEFSLYNIFSLLVILCFLLTALFPNQSTAIDRMSFYLYPLSIFVYIRCVQYRIFNLSRNVWKLIIISMTCVFTFYWLTNSDYAQEFWLPYKNYLFM